jgi:Protein of unknown function (DUF1761)
MKNLCCREAELLVFSFRKIFSINAHITLQEGVIMIFGNLEINVIAVVAAAVAYAALGPIWYSKFIFGKIWMRLRGLPEGLEMDFQPTAYMWGFILCLTTSFSLALVLEGLLVESVQEAAALSAAFGAGFVLTTTGTSGLFTSHKLGLWLIDNIYHVLGFALAGSVIAWM